ncbi:MAG: pyruvate, phosphate dikinase [Coriobacteriia bacterium]|nr:pyruvate, phosphate dikinase [Coriobacteriia bacterium]
MSDIKRVYAFGKDAQGENRTEGNKGMKFILGGKGANLAEMANMELPVPPGYTISCQTCMEYYNSNPPSFPDELEADLVSYTADLEAKMGKKLGDVKDPLLVSVRSGAAFSMPGMMDTILNLGLNDESIHGLISQTGNERFAWDSYRRFIQMFSNVVLNVEGDEFENAITVKKHQAGVIDDSELSANDLKDLVEDFKTTVSREVSADDFPSLVIDGKVAFPQDVNVQLHLAIEAVFSSWNNRRARDYRRMEKISDDIGTAVSVQSMVFGNKGETSATGVGFTRNPADGTNEYYGDFLTNAQGEDVVAGIRLTEPISKLKTLPGLEKAGEELDNVFAVLEEAYRDMCDIEFTIEQGKLWMLQTRVGKRTARAALKVAVDLVGEGAISKEEAVSRINPAQLDQLLHPTFDTKRTYDVVARGLNASPGAAVGTAVFSADDAEAAAARGERVVLVRWETTPDDLHGMVAAQGILTSHGGKTSHAAVIARGMGKPCVCGVDKLKIDTKAKQASVIGTDIVIKEGDSISIDGTSGILILGDADLVEPEVSGDFETILEWADEFRTLGVYANADNPEDAKISRDFGAEGIGLTRTEHMFLGERKDIIQDFILSDSDEGRNAALAKLLDVQVSDYLGIFEAMDGLPVTVRLLDPPLHEFLDNPRELEVELVRRELVGDSAGALAEGKKLLAEIDALSEQNPMLGMRGCRLGIVFPELYAMQVRSITRAAHQLKAAGKDPHPEIMIPLVSLKAELETLRAEAEAVIAEVEQETGQHVDIPIGTMIELPRAAITADEIGQVADFFSFGTNDLTQTAFGFSRDDVESSFLTSYLERKILDRNPFETLDDGVAQLVAIACEKGRKANPAIHLGICGEHGGDPESIHKCQKAGLTYVSCSPYRVPVARLAAAQAALAEKK